MHNWKSTYATKHLQEVVEKARPIDGLPLFSTVKGGVQKKNGNKLMIILYHTFERKDDPYLNFIAKLTIGVLADMKHIQNSVNKIEVQKQKTRPSYTTPPFRLDRPWSDFSGCKDTTIFCFRNIFIEKS